MNSNQRYSAFKAWMGKQKVRGNNRFVPKVPGDYASRLKNKRFLVKLAKKQLTENVFLMDKPKIVRALRAILDEMSTVVSMEQKDDYADLKTALKWYEKFLCNLKH